MLTSRSTHNMGIVAHIQDIAVARTQKGKKMGLRVLQALVHVAAEYGAFKVGFPLSVATQEFPDQVRALRSHTHGLNITGKAISDAGRILLIGTTSHSQTISDLVGDNHSPFTAQIFFHIFLPVLPLLLLGNVRTWNNLLTDC